MDTFQSIVAEFFYPIGGQPGSGKRGDGRGGGVDGVAAFHHNIHFLFHPMSTNSLNVALWQIPSAPSLELSVPRISLPQQTAQPWPNAPKHSPLLSTPPSTHRSAKFVSYIAAKTTTTTTGSPSFRLTARPRSSPSRTSGEAAMTGVMLSSRGCRCPSRRTWPPPSPRFGARLTASTSGLMLSASTSLTRPKRINKCP